MSRNLKAKTHAILDTEGERSTLGQVVNTTLLTLVFLNVLAIMLESMESLASDYGAAFRIFEVFSVGVFTIEYVLRLWSCTQSKRFSGPLAGRLKYIRTPMALVDAGAILPFYLPMIIPWDLRVLRALRLLRLFQAFRLGRYSKDMRLMGKVIKESYGELTIVAFVLVILLVIASSLMYYAEYDVQPEVFSSIPATMYWGIETLTTLGGFKNEVQHLQSYGTEYLTWTRSPPAPLVAISG